MPLAVVRTGPNDTATTPLSQYLYTLQHFSAGMAGAEAIRRAARCPKFSLSQQPAACALDLARQSARRARVRGFIHCRSGQLRSDRGDFVSAADSGLRRRRRQFDSLRRRRIRRRSRDDRETCSRSRIASAAGAIGNVAADTITRIEPGAPGVGRPSVTNPFPGFRRRRPGDQPTGSTLVRRRRFARSNTARCVRRTMLPPPRPCPGCCARERFSAGPEAG